MASATEKKVQMRVLARKLRSDALQTGQVIYQVRMLQAARDLEQQADRMERRPLPSRVQSLRAG
jgi:hypothetical protein